MLGRRLLPIAALVALPLVAGRPPPEPAPEPATGRARVILLGSGTPNPEPARQGPATAVVVDDAVYLFDAGPGIVRRAAAAGLEMPALRRAFITHLHSDHTAGLADLLLTPWVLERSDPLDLYGPPGIAAMAGHLQAAYAEDVRIRLDGLEPANPSGWEARAHEVAPGEVYRDDKVRVIAFEVDHGAWERAYGYRIEAPDRVIVIAGDTRPSDAVREQARGADLLLHEVICEAGLAKRTAEWQAYHRSSHTTGPELGRLAAAAQPRRLVLHHVLLSGCTEDELLAEVRGEFAGDVILGRDLDVF
ncbi:MAG: MBL fold metallo-hydrolase [Myxococcales bacterium]|nr:MBL fold metallo-hydrolase [Myxococcales bacterium]